MSWYYLWFRHFLSAESLSSKFHISYNYIFKISLICKYYAWLPMFQTVELVLFLSWLSHFLPDSVTEAFLSGHSDDQYEQSVVWTISWFDFFFFVCLMSSFEELPVRRELITTPTKFQTPLFEKTLLLLCWIQRALSLVCSCIDQKVICTFPAELSGYNKVRSNASYLNGCFNYSAGKQYN